MLPCLGFGIFAHGPSTANDLNSHEPPGLRSDDVYPELRGTRSIAAWICSLQKDTDVFFNNNDTARVKPTLDKTKSSQQPLRNKPKWWDWLYFRFYLRVLVNLNYWRGGGKNKLACDQCSHPVDEQWNRFRIRMQLHVHFHKEKDQPTGTENTNFIFITRRGKRVRVLAIRWETSVYLKRHNPAPQ